MSGLVLPRRRFLGGAAAAFGLAQLPSAAAAQTSGPIPSFSGLAWPSGVRDSDPSGFSTYRDRPIDVLVTKNA